MYVVMQLPSRHCLPIFQATWDATGVGGACASIAGEAEAHALSASGVLCLLVSCLKSAFRRRLARYIHVSPNTGKALALNPLLFFPQTVIFKEKGGNPAYGNLKK